MAKKNNIVNYTDCPVDLSEHQFYGLKLDEEQKKFRDAIWSKDKIIVFCNARSGTGKTTIATGVADLLVKYGRYDGIVYIQAPVQETKQGYLKGTLEDKSVYYFTPFYDALSKLGINLSTAMCSDIMNQKNGTGYIECMTHTFLRGTNFENKVIIIDETQNYTISELKKVLTRLHDNCKVIVIGHTGQIDLYKDIENSGFAKYLNHFKDEEQCEVCELTRNYRGWLSNFANDLT